MIESPGLSMGSAARPPPKFITEGPEKDKAPRHLEGESEGVLLRAILGCRVRSQWKAFLG